MMCRVQLSMMIFGGTVIHCCDILYGPHIIIIICIAHVWVGGFPYINVHNPLCLCDFIAVVFF